MKAGMYITPVRTVMAREAQNSGSYVRLENEVCEYLLE